MNRNYIAPAAFDDTINPQCYQCGYKCDNPETKIMYYQNRCPHCGHNPSPEVKPQPPTLLSRAMLGSGLGIFS